MTVRVKICGVRTPDDARVAAEAGADLIGLVLTGSPRRVTAEAAADIVASLGSRTAPAAAAAEPHRRLEAMLATRRPLTVGVFGDEPAEEIAATAQAAEVDVIQLSGRDPAAQAAALSGRAMLVAFRPEPGARIEDAPASALPLLDAPHPTRLGGTGLRVDVALAARCAATRPVVLAGGLTPENVADAIAAVRPWGVDVSGGVETDGAKDHDKIRSFIAAAKGVPDGGPEGIRRSNSECRDRASALSGPKGDHGDSASALSGPKGDHGDSASALSVPKRLSLGPERTASPRLATFEYMGPYAYSLTLTTQTRHAAFTSRVVAECLQDLSQAAARHGFEILAYCFMPDHLHLLVRGSDGSPLKAFVSLFKQRSGYRYRQQMHRPLWQRSFYDHVLRREEDIQAVAEYIWNNPVQAGLATAPGSYPFSGPPELLRSGQA